MQFFIKTRLKISKHNYKMSINFHTYVWVFNVKFKDFLLLYFIYFFHFHFILFYFWRNPWIKPLSWNSSVKIDKVLWNSKKWNVTFYNFISITSYYVKRDQTPYGPIKSPVNLYKHDAVLSLKSHIFGFFLNNIIKNQIFPKNLLCHYRLKCLFVAYSLWLSLNQVVRFIF